MTPTANLGYQSFYQAQLTAGISAADLTIPLDVVPTPSEGFLVLESTSSTKREIIYYTSKTSVSVVCPAGGRGYDGTTAQTHLQNSAVIMAPVAAMFEAMRDLFETTPQGWTPVTQTVSSVSYSGNRSYTLTMSADVSATLSPGMRVKTTRTVTAPIQCADLESGSSQYFTKASPAGTTFTDDWSASAWVKLESYTGARNIIINRSDYSTQGFGLAIESSGRVEVGSFRIAGNNSITTSYQSIPLNKWVHVAATTDLSGASVLVYIDGVLVPSLTTVSGTITALVQYTGDLRIGALSSAASQYFDGKIAQAAVFSAVLSAATIRSYYSQGLTGTETSLVSAYSFNGVITDLNTTNANNLTAQASAVATNADSPFGQDSNGVTAGTTDYALVMKVATTTVTVQVPEGCTIPTSGGVSAIAYSTATSPFGYTLDKERWAGRYILKTSNDKTSAITIATYYNINGNNFTLPVGGGWDIRGITSGVVTHAGVTYLATTIALSTSASTLVDERLAASTHFSNASLIENNIRYSAFTGTLTVTSATPVYVLNWTNQSATTLLRTSYMDVTYIPSGI